MLLAEEVEAFSQPESPLASQLQEATLHFVPLQVPSSREAAATLSTTLHERLPLANPLELQLSLQPRPRQLLSLAALPVEVLVVPAHMSLQGAGLGAGVAAVMALKGLSHLCHL